MPSLLRSFSIGCAPNIVKGAICKIAVTNLYIFRFSCCCWFPCGRESSVSKLTSLAPSLTTTTDVLKWSALLYLKGEKGYISMVRDVYFETESGNILMKPVRPSSP